MSDPSPMLRAKELPRRGNHCRGFVRGLRQKIYQYGGIMTRQPIDHPEIPKVLHVDRFATYLDACHESVPKEYLPSSQELDPK